MNIVNLPTQCPACNDNLVVTQLSCESCSTSINGSFSLPIFLNLSITEQEFIMQFFLKSGSLKEMALQLGISYPTVRNQLDDIISKINQLKNQSI